MSSEIEKAISKLSEKLGDRKLPYVEFEELVLRIKMLRDLIK